MDNNSNGADSWTFMEWTGAGGLGRFKPGVLHESSIRLKSRAAPDVNFLLQRASGSKELVVFLTSGRPETEEPLSTYYQMWRYRNRFGGANLMYPSDPTLKTPGGRQLTYGVHSSFDGAAALAEAVAEVADALEVAHSAITFYGSSQGGFLALAVASFFPSSKALVVVPVLDVRRSTGANRIIAEALNNDLDGAMEKFPERISLVERFRDNSCIPSATVVTNRDDFAFYHSLEFMKELSKISDEIDQIGLIELSLHPEPYGHNALSMNETIERLTRQRARFFPCRSGRRSTAARSERVEGAVPASYFGKIKEVAHHSRLKLSSKQTKWLELEEPRSGPFTFEVTFANSDVAAAKNIAAAFYIDGVRQQDVQEFPLALSRSPHIGFYRYIPVETGIFTRKISFELPPHCVLKAIGFRYLTGGDTPTEVVSVKVDGIPAKG